MAREYGSKTEAIVEFLAGNKKANPAQIVESLKEIGVDVSFGLARAVKYKKKGKKSWAKKGRRAMVAATSEPAVTGSESIRQFIANFPAAKPKEIDAGLRSEGIIVSKSLINAVKYGKGKKAGKRGRRRTAVVHAAARATSTTALDFKQLIAVKKFVDSFGGAEQIRMALDILEQLR